MTVFDTRGAVSGLSRLPVALGPPTDFPANVAAAFEATSLADKRIGRRLALEDAYDRYIEEIFAATGKKLENPVGARLGRDVPIAPGPSPRLELEDREAAFGAAVRELGLEPRPPAQLREAALELTREANARFEDVNARATFLGDVGAFVGAAGAVATDPPVLATMLFGAPISAGILRAALIEAGIAAGTEAAIQPFIQAMREEAGLPAGFEIGLQNVLFAAAGGAAFSSLLRGGVRAGGAVRARRIARQEARDALRFEERLVDLQRADPFDPRAPGASAEHVEGVSAAQRRLIDEAAPRPRDEPASPLRASQRQPTVKADDAPIDEGTPLAREAFETTQRVREEVAAAALGERPPVIRVFRGQTEMPFDPELESARFPGLVFGTTDRRAASVFAEGPRGTVSELEIAPQNLLDLRDQEAVVGSAAAREIIGRALGRSLGLDADIAPELQAAGFDAVAFRERIPGQTGAFETVAATREAVEVLPAGAIGRPTPPDAAPAQVRPAAAAAAASEDQAEALDDALEAEVRELLGVGASDRPPDVAEPEVGGATPAPEGGTSLGPVPAEPAFVERAVDDELAATPTGGNVVAIPVREIEVDAELFQFKSGGDAFGVTERLRGVTQWDETLAGLSLVYEFEDGRRFIVDGHQRLALARRIMENDPSQEIQLNALILRQADGVTPELARVRAAGKNIAEGTGTAVDAAKIIRDAPDELPPLPPRSALVQTAQGLARLSDDAFGMVVNEVVPANQAAIVGRLADEPALQVALIRLVADVGPANLAEAEAVVRQGIEAGFARQTQETLFGEEEIAESLFRERSKILGRALAAIRRDRATFNTLVQRQETISGAGNVLDTDANITRLSDDAQAIATLQATANRRGPLSDALTDAARRAKDSGKFGDATDEFVAAVRKAARDGTFGGGGDGAPGRGAEPAGDGAPAPGPGERVEPDPTGDQPLEQPSAAEADADQGLFQDIAEEPPAPAAGATIEVNGNAIEIPDDLVELLEETRARTSTSLIDTPERQMLRQEIADRLYGDGAPRKERRGDIVMGKPASGKSTVVADPLVERNGALLIDADEVKKLLPEFDDGRGSGAVHEESADIILPEILRRAMVAGDNIVLPVVGKTLENLENSIRLFKEAGYTVRLHNVRLPLDKSVERAIARFRSTGRLVDPGYVASIGDRPETNFDIILERNLVDGFAEYSNDVPRGEPPELLRSSDAETPVRLGRDRGSGDPEGRPPGGRGVEGESQALRQTEVTDAGDQGVIPGAERISERERLERRAGAPLRPRVSQATPDEGLFDVAGRGQADLLDQPLLVGEGDEIRSTTPRQVLEELDQDRRFLDELADCVKGGGS